MSVSGVRGIPRARKNGRMNVDTLVVKKTDGKSGENKWSLLIALTFIGVMPVLAVPPPKGVAPLLVPSGGFAIDGD